jgi:hypothetical protein
MKVMSTNFKVNFIENYQSGLDMKHEAEQIDYEVFYSWYATKPYEREKYRMSID